MAWGVIHRMIFVELIKVFSLALVAITGLIMLAGIISEAMKNGLGPAQIAACVPLLLPSLLPYTVPTTTLFATCIVYGRLSADSEILALKSAGVHIRHVIWPALFLGLATSAVTMFFYLDVIPATGSLLRNRIIGDVEEFLYAMLRKDGYIRHPNINVEIHVKNINGRTLQDVVFKRRAANGNGFDVVAVAKEAELRVDLAHRKILVDMRQCQFVQGGERGQGPEGVVVSRIWEVDVPNGLGGSAVKHRAMDMTWRELSEYYEKGLREKVQFEERIALLLAQMAQGKREPNDDKLLQSLKDERQFRQNLLFAIEAEWAMRPALALGCLCFALVGCPVGIWFSKSDYLSAFITCFLPIVIFYYPLMFCMFDLARFGKIPPAAGVFNADGIMLLAGTILFQRLAKN